MQYNPTQLIVDALERLHQDGYPTVRLPELVSRAAVINQPLAIEVFITANKRETVLNTDGELNQGALEDPTVYKSGAHFQFKSQLYHVGLLTSGGTDTSEAAVTDDWKLEHVVS